MPQNGKRSICAFLQTHNSTASTSPPAPHATSSNAAERWRQERRCQRGAPPIKSIYDRPLAREVYRATMCASFSNPTVPCDSRAVNRAEPRRAKGDALRLRSSRPVVIGRRRVVRWGVVSGRGVSIVEGWGGARCKPEWSGRDVDPRPDDPARRAERPCQRKRRARRVLRARARRGSKAGGGRQERYSADTHGGPLGRKNPAN